MENYEEKIYQLISDQFNTPIERLNENISFKGDLNADSLDLVQLIMAVEMELGIEAEDSDLDKIETIGDCLEYVRKTQE